MGCAMIGAICALVFFSRWHDRQIARLIAPKTPLPNESRA
jgi:hypothetical protein